MVCTLVELAVCLPSSYATFQDLHQIDSLKQVCVVEPNNDKTNYKMIDWPSKNDILLF